jgi:hypothetical protein
VRDDRRVVSLAVVLGRNFQDLARAVGNAEPAALTALEYDVDIAVRGFLPFGIERFAPVLHFR